jgi:uncharacterized membrane protein
MTNLEFNSGAISPGDCIGQGWNLVTRNLGLYIGVSLVGFLLIVLVSCIPIVNLFLISPLMGGLVYIALRDMNNEPIDFGMLFKGFEKFVPLMVVGIIQGIPGLIFTILRFTLDFANIFGRMRSPRSGTGDFFQAAQPDINGVLAGLSVIIIVVSVGFILFSIFWAIIFFFAIPLVLDRDMGPIDAIKLSARAALSNAGGIIVLLILGGLVNILGVIALCFGLLVSIPVTIVANTIAYRMVFPKLDQYYRITPPPPSAYGSTFGQGL